MAELVDEYCEYLETCENRRIATGMPVIDLALGGGMLPGEVIVILGKAGVGKTSVALNLAHGAATASPGRGVLIVSLEMGRAAITERLAQLTLALDRGRLVERIRTDVGGVRAMLSQHLPGVRVCDSCYTLTEINALVAELGPQVVVLDHLGWVRTGDSRIDVGSYERSSRIIRDLQAMAKQNSFALVALQQISRKGGYPYAPVTLEDARDSGVIEETADFVVGLHRTATSTDHGQPLGVSILKNRRGPSEIEADLLLESATYRVSEVANVG